MTAENEPLFSAILTPYRSLGRRGFFVLMLVFALICFVLGLIFLMLGAWPVFGFFGLDVLILYWAFKSNFNDQRAYEEIKVWSDRVLIKRVSKKGRIRELRFNPYWLKVERALETDENGTLLTALHVRSHGERHEIGAFLNPLERERFANAFSRALQDALRVHNPVLP